MTVPFSEDDVKANGLEATITKSYYDRGEPTETKSRNHREEPTETKPHDHKEELTDTKSHDHRGEPTETKSHDDREELTETKSHDHREEESKSDSDCDTLCSGNNSRQTVDNNVTNNVLDICNTGLLKMLIFSIWHSLLTIVNKITTNAVQFLKYYYAYHKVKVKVKLTSGNTSKLFEKQNRKCEWIFDWLLRPLQHIPQTVIITFPFFPKDYNSFLKEGQKPNTSDVMQFESSRFATFSTFPAIVGVYATRLAAAGFYYNGNGDEVVCFKCGVKYSNWQKHDSAKEIHKRISPGCSFVLDIIHMENGKGANNIVTGACGTTHDLLPTASKPTSSDICIDDANQSKVPGHSPYTDSLFFLTTPTNNSIVTNIQTHTNVNKSNEIPERKNLSENDTTSLVRIPQSNTVLGQAPSVTKTAHRDILRSPPINNNNNGSSESQTMGICLDKPKYPKYAIRATRLESFKDWSCHLSQRPEEMTLAGFFFTGTEDHCRCFFCGGGLKNWEPNDQPWVEHARWYQHCAFVLQCKGSKFVEDVRMNRYMSPLHQRPGNSEITAEMLLKAVFQLEGCSSGNMSTTPDDRVNHNKQTEGTTNKSTEHAASDPELELSIKSLEEENQNLRDQQTCKICLDKPVAIVFLPCGHMAYCVNCAPALRRCPICRDIKGTVKAIMC